MSENNQNDPFESLSRRKFLHRVVAVGVTAGGILISGHPASGNVVRGNRNIGEPAPIRNRAQARLEENEGYST